MLPTAILRIMLPSQVRRLSDMEQVQMEPPRRIVHSDPALGCHQDFDQVQTRGALNAKFE